MMPAKDPKAEFVLVRRECQVVVNDRDAAVNFWVSFVKPRYKIRAGCREDVHIRKSTIHAWTDHLAHNPVN
eukprot:m.137364 g.137364  ORF g.137364 m.137364 type:complete len:71 (+) comp13971_c1_seq1:839-1051(+)